MNPTKALVVRMIHMYEKENATAHRTSTFELVHRDPPTPVLRRGQEFNLVIRFNRPYNSDTDIVRTLFNFGEKPNALRGTRGVASITNRNEYLSDLEAWGVRMIGANGNDLSMEIRSPADSPIGVWSFNVETTVQGSQKPPNTCKYEKDIYLLFNPWLKEDLVYMEDEKLLDEYILNDVGKIWGGAYRSERGRPWIFGQFDASVLPACMLVLERSGLSDVARNDPIKMSRAITRAVNSNEDGGVIIGQWGEPYENGTVPSAWTGSVPILEQFWNSKEPVAYGQCWVFAGVVTTICRALGIPSRVVTNFNSAHDTNVTLSIDRFYDENNDEINDPINPPEDTEHAYIRDSVWNFHVWNDAWMARPDLPKGYGGWQAIDATPQEASDGLSQCGPAPLEAIKQGIVGFNYDVTFMVSTVNADCINWKEDPSSELGYMKISTDKERIGRIILTKAPWIFDPLGDEDREVITTDYKPNEDNPAERLTLLRAVRSTPTAKRHHSLPESDKKDVKFELVDLDRVKIGQPFAVTVNIKNESTQLRTIEAVLSAGSTYYNGIRGNLVKRAVGKFTVQPNAGEQLRLSVTVDDYLDKLVEGDIMKLFAIATVTETKQTWAGEDDFQVLKPTIKVKIEGEAIVGRPSTVSLSFANPLKRILTKCTFNYAGPGISKNMKIEFRDVGPEEEVRVEHQLVPYKSGPQTIIATFTSKQLTDVTGSAVIEVFDE